MKTVLFTIVLLLSGAAMATERTKGLLGDYTPPQSLSEPGPDWSKWEPSRGRANMPPDGQKLLDQLQAGQITGREFRYGMSLIGRREEQERQKAQDGR